MPKRRRDCNQAIERKQTGAGDEGNFLKVPAPAKNTNDKNWNRHCGEEEKVSESREPQVIPAQDAWKNTM
jgi:hypothetical protein